MGLVYLGVGSNIGDRLKNIKTASLNLSAYAELKTCSSVWETSPWGFTSQPYFLNCVLLFETALAPIELLKKVSQVELKLGRRRTQRIGPRIIDIDILFYNACIINISRLVIPHPRVHERRFVLLPLAEIAPDFVHPVLKKEVKELLEELNSKEKCKVFMSKDKFVALFNHEFTRTRIR